MTLEWLFALGILLVVGALVFGLSRGRSRNRANDPIREEATRKLYDAPETYEHADRQKLQSKLKPES